MNILPKKNWHVRSKTNIARVKADEAKAAEEAEKEVERIRIAEQEARTNLLRNKARERLASSDALTVGVLCGGEDGKNEIATNKDYELEKKEETEKKEKAIGLLSYLGQSALDPKPWWSEAPNSQKRKIDAEKSNLLDEWDTKKKRCMDPMLDMNRASDFFTRRDAQHVSDRNIPISHRQLQSIDKELPRLPEDILSPPISSRSKHDNNTSKSKKKKKKKKNRKEKKHSQDSSPEPMQRPETSKSVLEALRNERLNRERAERNREIAVIQRHHLEKSGVTVEREEQTMDERAMPYNSVFNPNWSRKPGKSLRKTNEEIVSDLLK